MLHKQCAPVSLGKQLQLTLSTCFHTFALAVTWSMSTERHFNERKVDGKLIHCLLRPRHKHEEPRAVQI